MAANTMNRRAYKQNTSVMSPGGGEDGLIKDVFRSYAFDKSKQDDLMDQKFNFSRLNNGLDQKHLGWLINVQPTLIEDEETHQIQSAVDLYFLEQDGFTFKVAYQFYPYFYVGIKKGHTREVEAYLQKEFDKYIHEIEVVEKIDLAMKNHLAGLTVVYLKLKFVAVKDLVACRGKLMPLVNAMQMRRGTSMVYAEFGGLKDELDGEINYIEYVEDIREYDIPYYERVLIDTDIRVSKWYEIEVSQGRVTLNACEGMEFRARPKIFAFDIECTKSPLKFPDANFDEVMMISYMIDGQGYLIVNRSHVSSDIESFEYNPSPEMQGPFEVWNELNELQLLNRFVGHIMQENPHIFVTFNGDAFDWKFLEKRCQILGVPLSRSLGLEYNKQDEYYFMRRACHLDVFHWVRRDSYLPQGSQGLKSVTRIKLGYNPLEIDPELLVLLAIEKPIEVAQYSVSDAVATYYMYMKYIHPFIFSLCSILPMNPDHALRKGTGTLCEALLMVEAYKKRVIFPNKKFVEFGKMYNGHLIESETYVGGHVETLAAGIYRHDLPITFKIDSKTIDALYDQVEKIVDFCVSVEYSMRIEDLTNREEVIGRIRGDLRALDVGVKGVTDNPYIYHLDVASMYPNIILTNRLQPTSVVDDEMCSSCLFNDPANRCRRVMRWQWRLDYMPANRNEYERIKSQLELEFFSVTKSDGSEEMVSYLNLSKAEQYLRLKSRLKEYCKVAYKRTHEISTIERNNVVCMRENSFYVDTVRAFRDRRYIYRSKTKEWAKRLEQMRKEGDLEGADEAENMVVLYESLQLAHKCILNSFYGYVMRKGARWYSMEMAAIVTNVGSEIIKRSLEAIEKIGKPLELDTDGIWCSIPKNFPGNYELLFGDDKKSFNFICSMLNMKIHGEFSNSQYQELLSAETLEYSCRNECTIFFEVDGPYRAMVLPLSIHEGKQLKKRYAVFGFDGKLREFKGFELKRRGELKVIKDFQSQIFSTFLLGNTLEEAYRAAAEVANYFLDILDTKAEALTDKELLELLSESRSMSKNLDEYQIEKSTSINTAKRLAEFLGDLNAKEKGLTCQFIISKKPEHKSVTERTIPIQIFSAEPTIQYKYLRSWCDEKSNREPKLREILDWDYYRSRLSIQFQKLIILPAYSQGISNPIPRIKNPDWIVKNEMQLARQKKISDIFVKVADDRDIEDVCNYRSYSHGDDLGVEKDATDFFVRPDIQMEIDSQALVTIENGRDGGEAVKVGRGVDGGRGGADGARCDEDSLEWLREHQSRWREMRERWRTKGKRARSSSKEGEEENSNILSSNGKKNISSLTNFFISTKSVLVEGVWQVMKVEESVERRGEVDVWVMVGRGRVLRVGVRVLRVMYVNSFVRMGDGGGEAVGVEEMQKVLPRMRPRHNLYEVAVEEERYWERYYELEQQRLVANVEGIYESRVPLGFRVIMKLGCLCRMKRGCSRVPEEGEAWDLSDLESVEPGDGDEDEIQYLRESAGLRCVYLYQAGVSRRMSFFGVYDMALGRAKMIYVSPRRQEGITTLERKFSEIKGNSIESQYTHTTSMEDALRQVRMELEELCQINGDECDAVLVVMQCSIKNDEEVRNLVRNLVVLKLEAHGKDCEWPAINWLERVSNIFIQRASQVDKWYDMAIKLARYTRVPIGNFEKDFAILLSDILYCRMLKSNDMILWYSEITGEPDLGGNEENDPHWLDQSSPLEILNPNCVDAISADLKIKDLAVDSVMQADSIPDFELNSIALDGTGNEIETIQEIYERNGGKLAPNPLYIYDENASCMRAFKVLKLLVTKWSIDTIEYSGIADIFLHNFYRWISSPESRIYDPALHGLVRRLMRKVFLHMLSEFKKMGCDILYASFNRLIVSTRKFRLQEAQTYCTFLRDVFRRNLELFKWIELEPVQYFDVLLFRDPHNFVGIPAGSNDSQHSICPISNFHVINFLPDGFQKFLNIILFSFVLEIYEHKKKILDDIGRDPNLKVMLDAKKAQLENERGESNSADLVDLVSEYYRDDCNGDDSTKMTTRDELDDALVRVAIDKLVQGVEEVKALISQDKSILSSPVYEHVCGLLDDANGGRNPLLDLIKIVISFFSLKKSIAVQMVSLKKNLLKCIKLDGGDVGQANESDQFFQTFVVSNVVCEYCNSYKDIDLLKDSQILKGNWSCQNCSSIYDKTHVEMKLLETVQQWNRIYLLQETQCEKCNKHQGESMSLLCRNCSGKLSFKNQAKELKKKYAIFNFYMATIDALRILIVKKISSYYEMEVLEDLTLYILSLMAE